MTDSVFCVRSKLRRAFAGCRIKKNRIIAKTIFSPRRKQHRAWPLARYNQLLTCRRDSRNRRLKMTAALLGGTGAHIVEQLAHVALITAFARQGVPVIAIAGGINAWRAKKGVHNKTGIIRNGNQAACAGHMARLEQRVFRKCSSGFRYLANLGQFFKPDNFNIRRCKQLAKFGQFSRIAAGNRHFLLFHPASLFLHPCEIIYLLQAGFNLPIIKDIGIRKEACVSEALMIVDPQCDFITGSLPVPGAEAAMRDLARHLRANPERYALVLVTLDFHPWNHCSFDCNGGQWPRHCVAHSQGAAIWPELLESIHSTGAKIHSFCKGAGSKEEQYSIFQDKASRNALETLFRDVGITTVDLCGLAGDVCVLNTLRDGIGLAASPRWRVLAPYSPSLDGGALLASFCAEKGICIR